MPPVWEQAPPMRRLLAASRTQKDVQGRGRGQYAAPMPSYSFPMLDSKWLDLLKANGWQFACLTLVCAMVIFADKHGWLPVSLDHNFRQGTMLAGFVFAA